MRSLLITLLISSAFCADPPRPPPGWGAFLKLDREFNSSIRPVMSQKDAAVCPIYHVDIPVDQTDTVQSEFLDASTRDRVFIEKEGKKFVRFYFADHPQMTEQMPKLEILKKKGYAFDGHGVIAFEKKTGRAVAYAFDLKSEQVQRAVSSAVPPKAQPWCPWGFKTLSRWIGWRRVPSLPLK